MPTYSELHAEPIRATIEQLGRRIEERFPGSGLARVAAEMGGVAERNQQVVLQLRRPMWKLRAVTALAIGSVLGIAAWAAAQVARLAANGVGGVSELLEGIDAATSELIFLAIVIAFFASLETRLKRKTALAMLHRLRSLAHVVDMHQLTKDPEHVLRPVPSTASSPKRVLTHAELGRYLDYCAEMLALTSKLAALHAQHLQDPVVLNAVNDIESLSADLSEKVWQKISILDALQPRGTPGAAG